MKSMLMQMVIVAGTMFGIGCAHKQTTKPSVTAAEVKTPAAQVPADSSAAAPPASRKTCQSDLECGERQLCIRGECVDISPELAECSLFRVHFDFDKSDIRPDDLPKLQRMARCLKADQVLHVTIEGNTDERGTEEYNLALGDNRATAVASYLERLGVSATQLKTISYGEEKPLCTARDEACWAKNRRAAVKPAFGR